uniref:SCP domain-containing protein n=1 Tax=Oryza brachyantha TaxID=4533 RepID=J3LWJ0_ORYBR
MTSRVSCLAVILSLLALSSAAAAVVPRGPTTVAKFLSAERRWYDAGTGACAAGKQCGDYRIMVRPASTQLGCAVAVCASSVSGSGSDKTIMVCEYYPGH